ncbi:hypothetical protein D1AOALGA4SA_6136 [Olavius algarvensis Delta 1 endosymbiont]|nr:hypothetical protein D1AOALGA4SA_6136 [Olavius algarvensis Delta 1 endosymbiont]
MHLALCTFFNFFPTLSRLSSSKAAFRLPTSAASALNPTPFSNFHFQKFLTFLPSKLLTFFNCLLFSDIGYLSSVICPLPAAA